MVRYGENNGVGRMFSRKLKYFFLKKLNIWKNSIREFIFIDIIIKVKVIIYILYRGIDC